MTTSQILEAIRLMPSIERLAVVEYALRLMREDLSSDNKTSTEFTDRSVEDFVKCEDSTDRQPKISRSELLGCAKGLISMRDDFDAPLADFQEYYIDRSKKFTFSLEA